MVKTDRAYEQEILIRLKNGDTSAMRELYALYGDYVYTIAYSFTLSESDSAEISQDVFLKIWKSAKAYDENRSSLRTWIARIAKNTSIDKVRKKNPEPAGEEIDLLLNNIPETVTPEDELLEKEESKRVKDALNKLPKNQREVILLAYFSGLSQNEIAIRYKLPLGTVKSRIRQGLLKLKDLLE